VVERSTEPISLKNYDKRMLWYGTVIKKWGNEWPVLSHDPNIPSTANETAWHEYFRNHLGGFPPAYRLFRDGKITFLNMPEELPENFDPTYHTTR
jgi:hypothetical protein